MTITLSRVFYVLAIMAAAAAVVGLNLGDSNLLALAVLFVAAGLLAES